MVKCSLFGGSYYSTKKEIKIAQENLKSLGFDEIESFSPEKRYNKKWAGTPEERLNLFYKSWNSDSKIIFGVRGGSGISHFFQQIDKTKLNKKKLFCGYSDLTLILLFLNQKLNLISLHGPNSLKELDEKTISALKKAMKMENYGIKFKESDAYNLKEEIISGTIIGGNLTRINEYLIHENIDFNKKIIFIEDVNITREQIISYLFHLRNYYSFKPSAILFGDLGIKLNEEIRNLILEIFPNIPLIFNLPFGHVTSNITIPIGAIALISTKNQNITFIFPKSEKSYSIKLEN